jgi:GntR family galactonate operon transcriptional repressor
MTMLDTAALRRGLSPKRNLFTHIVEALGSRIVSGGFKPGAALPNEAELGQEFGASRSVIREAVKSLAAKGLLESRTRTGIRVLTPMHWNLFDPDVLGWRYSAMPPAQFFSELFEIRGVIEPHASALAAERANQAEINEMAAAYAAMQAVEEPGPAAIQADLRFHRAILAGAHNDLLLQMGSLIAVGLSVSYRLSSDSYTIFLPLHQRVLNAIAARKPQAASDAMARLISDTRTFLDARLKDGKRRRRPAKTEERIRARS